MDAKEAACWLALALLIYDPLWMGCSLACRASIWLAGRLRRLDLRKILDQL